MLTTLALAAAASVLPHYIPDMSGSLRQQPVVRKALDVARLLQKIEAVDGYNPAVGAGGWVGGLDVRSLNLAWMQAWCCCLLQWYQAHIGLLQLILVLQVLI